MADTVHVCTFRLDRALYGLDVQHVQEVLCNVSVTYVPLASRLVNGLINLRGQIVAAIDLRGCLGLEPPTPTTPSPISIVVRAGEELMCLQADEIGDVLSFEPTEFEATPPVLGDPESELLAGVYKLPSELLRVLNLPATVAFVLSRRTENVVHGNGLPAEPPRVAD